MAKKRKWKAPFSNPVAASLRQPSLRARVVKDARRALATTKSKHRKREAGD